MKRIILLAALLTALVISTTVLAQEEDQEQAKVTAHWSPYKYPTTFPENAKVHVIVKGDSLWAIAQKYYNNPLAWPQIHAANPYISDNHWIYPGDPVLLPDMTITEAGKITDPAAADEVSGDPYLDDPSAEGQPEADGNQDGNTDRSNLNPNDELVNFANNVIFETEPRQTANYQMLASDLKLYCSGAIYPKKLETDIWIAGRQEDRQIEIQQYDILYLNVGKNKVKPGELYLANHYDKKVMHPVTNEFIGHAYQEVGIVKILIATEDHAVAEALYTCDGLKMGAILIPFEERANPIVPVRQTMDIPVQYSTFDPDKTAHVVYLVYDGISVAASDTCNINLGSKDGLKEGDLIYIIDNNPLEQMYKPIKDQKPVRGKHVSRIIAEGHVMTLKEETCAIKLTYSFDDVRIGFSAVPAKYAEVASVK